MYENVPAAVSISLINIQNSHLLNTCLWVIVNLTHIGRFLHGNWIVLLGFLTFRQMPGDFIKYIMSTLSHIPSDLLFITVLPFFMHCCITTVGDILS